MTRHAPFAILAALALAVTACGGGGGGATAAAPAAAAPALDGLGDGVLLRLSIPEEGRSWSVAWAFAAGPGDDGVPFSVSAEGSHVSRFAPAEATAAGEVGVSAWRESIEIQATVTDENGESVDPFAMARMAAGVDVREAIRSIEGVPVTLSLTPRGALRDVTGVEGLMEAFAAALGHELPDEFMDVPDFRAETEEALAAISAAGLEGRFPFVEGILPEAPVTAETVIEWSLADSIAAMMAAEGDVPSDEIPAMAWSMTPTGLLDGAVVFAIEVAGGFSDGGGGFTLAGGGTLEIEAATGLPRSLEISVAVEVSGPDGTGFPVSFRLTADPA